MQMEDQWNRSQIHPEPELCHLFTDGSCHGGRHRLYQLAAWAVVSATNDCCVANGVLGGLGQDNDRAELRAVIAAVQYAIEMQKNTVIWTDSTFAAEGMVRLLHDAADLPEGHCGEDRVELQGLLCHGEVQLQIHHENSGACKISFLELAVYVATEGKKWVPMPHLHRAGCWQDRDAFNFSEPNLGALVSWLKPFSILWASVFPSTFVGARASTCLS